MGQAKRRKLAGSYPEQTPKPEKPPPPVPHLSGTRDAWREAEEEYRVGYLELGRDYGS